MHEVLASIERLAFELLGRHLGLHLESVGFGGALVLGLDLLPTFQVPGHRCLHPNRQPGQIELPAARPLVNAGRAPFPVQVERQARDIASDERHDRYLGLLGTPELAVAHRGVHLDELHHAIPAEIHHVAFSHGNGAHRVVLQACPGRVRVLPALDGLVITVRAAALAPGVDVAGPSPEGTARLGATPTANRRALLARLLAPEVLGRAAIGAGRHRDGIPVRRGHLLELLLTHQGFPPDPMGLPPCIAETASSTVTTDIQSNGSGQVPCFRQCRTRALNGCFTQWPPRSRRRTECESAAPANR